VPKTRLTELSVKNALPHESQYVLWDASLPNFGVRVSPGGTKSFIAMFGARRERVSIGRYPIISLAEARTKAKQLMAARVLGEPQSKTIKFSAAFEIFKEQHCAHKRPSTARGYKRTLNVHFLPKLREERLADISPEMLACITDKLVETPGEQAHAQAVARMFFRWAVRRRFLKHSPLEGVQINLGQSRDRFLDDAELAAVWRATAEYPFGPIVRLLILTGQRRGEIGALKREYINPKDRTITLPSTLTKNRRAHTFPYGNMTATVLDELPRLNSEYLFPARGNYDAPFSGWSKCKQSLDEALVNVAPWTLHDLRRTFATNHAAIGTSPHITERLLNHVSGVISGVAAIYNRYAYRDEMRCAIEKWEERLSLSLHCQGVKSHETSQRPRCFANT
jgi:integrase